MNVPGPVTSTESRTSRSVFVSYANADRKEALSVTKAIERRGTKCWISTRDVAPGENYQEEIVRAIRAARAMVLVFSQAANNSDEIKKELSLASRYHVPVMALRIEDVEPSDAFAYELSTRQWIDAFEGWDHSIDALVTKLEQVSVGPTSAPIVEEAVTTQHQRARIRPWLGRWAVAGTVTLALLAIAGVLFWQQFATTQPLTVQVGKFQALSGAPADTPAAFQQALADTIGDENAVEIRGKDATYTLAGTITNLGDKLDYAVRLMNTRSGDMLWSASRAVAAGSAGPHQAAASVGWVVRCGLVDAMESPKPLPPRALALYLQHCELENWGGAPTRALDVAKQVVDLAPNFSKGWSRMAIDEGVVASSAPGDERNKLISSGNEAVQRAIALDPRNGNAYLAAAILTSSKDWARRELMLRHSVEVRESDCGCEHQHYAMFLLDVGRPTEAVVQAQRSVDMQPTSPSALDVLAMANYSKGDVGTADRVVASRTSFWRASPGSNNILLYQAVETKRWNDAASSAKTQFTEPTQAPLANAFAALASGNSGKIDAARAAVVNMTADASTSDARVWFLSAVGDTRDALAILKAPKYQQDPDAAAFLLDPMLARLRTDPGWVELLENQGLIKYWHASKRPPEFCKTVDAPPFCRTL